MKLSELVEIRRDLRTDIKKEERNLIYRQQHLKSLKDEFERVNQLIKKREEIEKGMIEAIPEKSDVEAYKDLHEEIGEDYITVDGTDDVVDLRTGKRSHPKMVEEDREVATSS